MDRRDDLCSHPLRGFGSSSPRDGAQSRTHSTDFLNSERFSVGSCHSWSCRKTHSMCYLRLAILRLRSPMLGCIHRLRHFSATMALWCKGLIHCPVNLQGSGQAQRRPALRFARTNRVAIHKTRVDVPMEVVLYSSRAAAQTRDHYLGKANVAKSTLTNVPHSLAKMEEPALRQRQPLMSAVAALASVARIAKLIRTNALQIHVMATETVSNTSMPTFASVERGGQVKIA